jgi:hypothetical protein
MLQWWRMAGRLARRSLSVRDGALHPQLPGATWSAAAGSNAAARPGRGRPEGAVRGKDVPPVAVISMAPARTARLVVSLRSRMATRRSAGANGIGAAAADPQGLRRGLRGHIGVLDVQAADRANRLERHIGTKSGRALVGAGWMANG